MKIRPFEFVLVAVFVGLAIFSLILLSTFQSRSGKDDFFVGRVSIWGTLDGVAMKNLLDELTESNETYAGVSYRQVDEQAFSSELTNALADGVGPDIVLLSHEQLVDFRRRISPISYDSFPIRDVRTSYVDGAEIFALSDGLYAYPVAVDPLMLYWNRDMLTNSNLLTAPQSWEGLINSYVPNLTTRDFDRTITKSAVALGEYQNVRNAFGIISTLLLQSGSRLVEEEGTGYQIRLNDSVSGGEPLVTTVDFYTRFSRPNNTLYSWNRSFTSDRQSFLAEDLAMYFGYGSEGKEIERLNPNLNFDIAEMPQGASATVRRTYGKFYGLALLRSSQNVAGAAAVMGVLSSQQYAEQIALDNNLVPASRASVAAGSNDTYGRLAYRSAAIAYGWLSPSQLVVSNIFTTMTRDVTEGRFNETGATADALERLQVEYN